MPTVFQFFQNLKILGLDWFTYLIPPLTLPKIVEDINVIKLLKKKCDFYYKEKKFFVISFKQFGKSF